MKPIIIESPWICKKLSWFIEVYAITLWPFIICVNKDDALMINHESIHIKQQTELLVVGFWLLYVGNWLYNLITKRDTFKAYYEIIFEKEAYDKEEDFDYLKNRSPYAWITYR